jgi:hypothetical protein
VLSLNAHRLGQGGLFCSLPHVGRAGVGDG